MKLALATIALLLLAPFSAACAADLIVTLPDKAPAKDAAALEPSSEPGQEGQAVYGKVDGNSVSFTDLQPATPYDLKITLKDGRVLRGVNLAWYSREPARADAAPLNDDDRKQISDLVSQPKSFYNISRITALAGSHDRATALVERIRSTEFHSAAGGEVIWRMELWYFTNDFGGWGERTETNKVLRRERYKTNDEYQSEVSPLKWLPSLGGIVLETSQSTRQIKLNAGDLSDAATRPSQ